jgi:ABC-type methionine transport system ATPase subunit
MVAGLKRRAAETRGRDLLDLLGLSDKAKAAPGSLSGGQRQRLALACAVATTPGLLLADEPTSQLSHVDRDAVVGLLHDLNRDFGTTVVVVTHQPEVAATFPRTVTMKGGRVGSEGHHGAEYAVIGSEGVLHLPSHLTTQWPVGTLVRVDAEPRRIVISHPADETGIPRDGLR